jgi:hypothetical protein
VVLRQSLDVPATDILQLVINLLVIEAFGALPFFFGYGLLPSPDALLLCLQPASSALLLPPSALLVLQWTVGTGLLQRCAAAFGLVKGREWLQHLVCTRLPACELSSEDSCMMCQSKAVAAVHNTRLNGNNGFAHRNVMQCKG